MKIPWDLEETSLQIKTDSKLGSNKLSSVQIYGKYGSWSYIGNVAVKFTSPMQYSIYYCTGYNSYIDLPVQPPAGVEKIWTFNKTETAIIITCNGVVVLNYLFAASSDSSCVTRWGGDVVEQIKFTVSDTASDFYKAGWGLH